MNHDLLNDNKKATSSIATLEGSLLKLGAPGGLSEVYRVASWRVAFRRTIMRIFYILQQWNCVVMLFCLT